jgi:hypothetical protein
MPQRSLFTRSASYGAFSPEEQAKIDALSGDLTELLDSDDLASFDPATLQSQEYIDWFAENASSLSGSGKYPAFPK